MSTGESVDLSRIQEISQGDEAFEREIFSLFLSDCIVRTDAIDGALAAGDQEALKREAHSLKGASANVGAEGLRQLSRDVELAISGDDARQLRSIVSELRQEAGRVREFIKSYLAG